MNRSALLVALAVLMPGCALFGIGPKPSAPPVAAAPPPLKDDPRFDHSAAELAAFIEEHTEGYTASGKPIEGTLDAFEPLDVEMKRGTCYRFVVRLADGAAFGPHARRGVVFAYVASGQPTVNGGPGVHGPGAVASGGCPQANRQATFDMYANAGSASDKSRLHELGSGGFTAQLYTKSISEAELVKQAADTERQLAESARFNEEYRRAEAAREAERERERASAAASASTRAANKGPGGNGVVSVSLKNECRQTVKLFYGDKPKFGSGTYSSLGGNTRTSMQMREGDMIWLVDEGQNGLGAVTVSSAANDVEILQSCGGIVAR